MGASSRHGRLAEDAVQLVAACLQPLQQHVQLGEHLRGRGSPGLGDRVFECIDPFGYQWEFSTLSEEAS
jgi:hypothetical protein